MILGRRRRRAIASYAHLARDSVKLSAAKVAASIGTDILPDGSPTGAVPAAPS